jgi:hypothetical protein
MHWLLHVLGVDTQQSYAYDAWSGCIPALLTSATISAATAAFLRRHNCEVHRCPRLGRHATAAGHRVCRRHSPGGAPTHSEVIAAHDEAVQSMTDKEPN